MAEILRYTLSHPSYLPSSYTPVAYLESSGSLWIDTGIKPSGNNRFYSKWSNITLNAGALYGNYNGNYTAWAMASGYNWRFGDLGPSPIPTLAANTTYNIVHDKGGIKINSKDYTSTYSGTPTSSTDTIKLFAISNSSTDSTKSCSSARLYFFKIWDGDSLIRDFHPCYYQPTSSSTPVYGMFDIIQLKFYSSASSTAFTGSVELALSLPSEYQQVEYLLFNAGKYYTTDIAVAASDTLTVTTGISYKSGESGRDLMGYSGSLGGYWGVTAAGAWEAHGTNFSYSLSDITKYTTIVYTKDDSYSGTWLLGALVNKYTTRTKYISSVKIVKNSSTVADYIACYQRSDGQLGFYDLATSSFKAVGSTIGEFPLGPSLPWLAGVGNDVIDVKLEHLPTGYTLLDYVQGNGSAIIDTGWKPTLLFKIQLRMKRPTLYNDKCICGSRTGAGSSDCIQIFNDTSSSRVWVGNCLFNTGIFETVDFGYNGTNAYCITDTNLTLTGSTNRTASTVNVLLFACTSGWLSYDRLYYFKGYNKDNVLARYMIPAKRNSDSVVGMYDIATHTFYTASGTLTAGPVSNPCNGIPYNLHSSPSHPQGVYHNLPSGYLEVEWVEAVLSSSSTLAYINTGVNGFSTATDEIEFTCMVTASGSASVLPLFGSRGSSAYADMCWIGLNNKYYMPINNSDKYSSSYGLNNKVTFKRLPGGAGYIEGELLGTLSATTDTGDILMFAGSSGSSNTPDFRHTYTIRVYYARIAKSGSDVRLFIPCIRTSDSKVGMYDTVNMLFYAPAQGTLSPGPAVGRLEGGIDFNGSSSVIKTNFAWAPSSTFTVSVWYRRRDSSTNPYGSILRNDSKYSPIIDFDAGNTIRFFFWYSASSHQMLLKSGTTDTDWHHLAMSYNGSTFVAYYDGTSIGSISCTSTPYSTGNMVIGYNNNTGYFNGYLYNFRIWDEYKNADAIKAIYLAK